MVALNIISISQCFHFACRDKIKKYELVISFHLFFFELRLLKKGLCSRFVQDNFQNKHKKLLHVNNMVLEYSARRLIGSRIIESAAYCNHKLMAHLYFNSTQNTSVNWIIRLLLSLLCWPKVILLSGGHCNMKSVYTYDKTSIVLLLFNFSKKVYEIKSGRIIFRSND